MSTVVEMVKERCFLLPDFIKEAAYFFQAPQQIDTASIKQKWTANKAAFFDIFCEELITLEEFTAEKTEALFKNLAAEKEIKAGEVLLPFRIMLVGGKFGPAVFDIATVLGKEEVVNRVKHALSLL
jgi:glutamyl-tRNA synthetase